MEVACARLTFDVTIALHATVLTEFGSPLLVAHGRYQTSKCAAAMVRVRACSRLAQWLATVDNTNTIFERSGGETSKCCYFAGFRWFSEMSCFFMFFRKYLKATLFS